MSVTHRQPLWTVEGVRLSAEYRLYRGPDGGWRLACPNGVERVAVSADLGEVLEGLFTGHIDYPEATRRAGQDVLDTALYGFADRGLLVAPDAQRPVGLAVVAGTGAVADRLAEILSDSGHDVRRADAGDLADVLADANVLVACAGDLPDSAWQDLDERCERAGVAWHRCYREAGTWVLGPFTVPAHSASYRDTRARRLAAARLPAELTALWCHLDDRIERGINDEGPDPATAAVVAGMLATDTVAFLLGRTVPSLGHQLVVDPATLAVTRHRVLPLPADRCG